MADVMDKTGIECRIDGQIGRVHLNRPKALNALNLEMVQEMTKALLAWQTDPAVRAVVVTAEGDKAFCAGGDVLALAESSEGDNTYARTFFAEEYRLNHLTGTYPKPYVCLMDGVIMGGGCGISMHGMRRVVGENVKMAMPETGIGLFPDVGGGHFLSRMPGQTGTWLALTGARLKTADVMALGLMTHAVKSSSVSALAEVLAHTKLNRPLSDIDEILRGYATVPALSELEAHRAEIDQHFAFDTMEEIMASLQGGSEWAQKQAETLAKKSPTSLKITLAQLRKAKHLNLAECLRMEYRMGWRVMQGHDFSEGVRALLVDKDNKARWKPDSLASVSDEAVAAHFESLGENELKLIGDEQNA